MIVLIAENCNRARYDMAWKKWHSCLEVLKLLESLEKEFPSSRKLRGTNLFSERSSFSFASCVRPIFKEAFQVILMSQDCQEEFQFKLMTRMWSIQVFSKKRVFFAFGGGLMRAGTFQSQWLRFSTVKRVFTTLGSPLQITAFLRDRLCYRYFHEVGG